MKTLEERKEIAIEWLMEYTNTESYDDCWYKLKTILELMIEYDVIHDYDSKELNKLLFEDEK